MGSQIQGQSLMVSKISYKDLESYYLTYFADSEPYYFFANLILKLNYGKNLKLALLQYNCIKITKIFKGL